MSNESPRHTIDRRTALKALVTAAGIGVVELSFGGLRIAQAGAAARKLITLTSGELLADPAAQRVSFTFLWTPGVTPTKPVIAMYDPKGTLLKPVGSSIYSPSGVPYLVNNYAFATIGTHRAQVTTNGELVDQFPLAVRDANNRFIPRKGDQLIGLPKGTHQRKFLLVDKPAACRTGICSSLQQIFSALKKGSTTGDYFTVETVQFKKGGSGSTLKAGIYEAAIFVLNGDRVVQRFDGSTALSELQTAAKSVTDRSTAGIGI